MKINCLIEIITILLNRDVRFEFRQCGTHFIKDGKQYTINPFQLAKQAKEANINC